MLDKLKFTYENLNHLSWSGLPWSYSCCLPGLNHPSLIRGWIPFLLYVFGCLLKNSPESLDWPPVATSSNCGSKEMTDIKVQSLYGTRYPGEITSLSVCQVARATGEPKSGMSWN